MPQHFHDEGASADTEASYLAIFLQQGLPLPQLGRVTPCETSYLPLRKWYSGQIPPREQRCRTRLGAIDLNSSLRLREHLEVLNFVA